MDYNLKKNIIMILERTISIILSFTICLICYISGLRLELLKGYQSLFSNTISFASIFIGVLMTMVALILGYANRAVIKRIRQRNAGGILASYFIEPIVSGFILVIASLVLNNVYDEKLIASAIIFKFITLIWVFLVTFFISSTLRVVWLMLYILKEVFYEDIQTSEPKTENSKSTDELDFDKDCF